VAHYSTWLGAVMAFLRNVWYVAANAYELAEGMVARTICNENIVMFRTSSGAIAALEDKCPHRFVPLSMGKRVGDTVQCGYHGLRFDRAGACVEAPNDEDKQRARTCVKSYVAVERYAVIWLWIGDAERADPDRIPSFNFLSDKGKFGTCQGYTHIKANYQLLADNLLDLSHVHYLHPQIHEGSDFSKFTNEIRRDGDTVWSMLWRHHYHLDKQRQAMWGFADDVEGQGHSRWDAPGVLLVETAYWDHGKSLAEGGVETPSSHMLTPETEFTCHYFWGSGRTFDIHNEAMSAGTAQLMQRTFETQDGPMVAAQQRSMGNSTNFLDHRPIILRADAAGVMARRIMMRKIKEQAKPAEAPAESPETAGVEGASAPRAVAE
jgi:phenylpropionate dioxygenase-like ring-hydroxylating dioxygenase large terminal subunit